MTSTSRARARGEGGFTLLEATIVSVLVGSIILALVTGLATTTVAARKANEAQRLSLGLTAFSEGLRDLGYYQGPADCTPEADAAEYLERYRDLPAAQQAATDGMRLQITKVEYWKGNKGNTELPPVAAADQWTASCSELSGAQKLTLKVGIKNEHTSARAEIVKRSGSKLG